MSSSSPKAHPGNRFWAWFINGTGAKAGWKNLVGRSTVFQLLAALALSLSVRKSPDLIASSVILPVTSIAVALAFAWGAASLPLLTSKPVRRLGRANSGGLPEFANYFQLAMLVILSCVAGWGITAAGPYEVSFDPHWPNFTVVLVLFYVTAVAFTECWSVIDLARTLFLAAAAIEDIENP